MTTPTLDNVSRPKAFGFGLALDNNLFRVATGFGSRIRIVTAPSEAPRVDTATSAEEIVEEFGRVFARSSFEGGEGLLRAHLEGAAPNRYWDSRGIATGVADSGEFDELTLGKDVDEGLDTTDAVGVRLTRTSTEVLYARGQDIRVTANPAAAVPTFATEDPHDGNAAADIRGLAALGDTVYAAIGASGVHRRVSGTWSHYSDLAATAVWAAQGRVLASDGVSFYEVIASGAAPSATTTLDAGEKFTSVADAGIAVLAGSTDGRVRAYTSDAGTLVLSGQTLFEGEKVVSLSSTQGLIAVGTRTNRTGRLWVGQLADDFALADLQLVREWTDDTRTRAPWKIVSVRTSFYVTVTAETGRNEVDVWCYDARTAGVCRYLTFPLASAAASSHGGTAYQSGADSDLTIFDGTIFQAYDGYGVSRESADFLTEGWLIGPLGDFFSASAKSWVGARMETDDIANGRAELYYTTDPDALKDPDSSTWRLVISRSTASNDEMALESVTGRWMAGMVRLYTTDVDVSPSVRSFGFRAYAAAGDGDVVVTIPVNVSDQIERRGRARVRARGLGGKTFTTLKGFESRPVLLRLYRPDETVRGLVESVETPVPTVRGRGSVTLISTVTVRGRRVGMAAGGGGFSPGSLSGLHAWFAADLITGLSDTDEVAQWDDESGNGRHATQGTAADRPIYRTGILNSLPVVRFDGMPPTKLGTASWTALSQPNDIFAVFINLTSTNNDYIIDGITATNRHTFRSETDNDWGMGTSAFIADVGAMDTDPHLVTARFNTTSSVMRIDGVQVATGNVGSETLTGLSFGARHDGEVAAEVDLAEVVLYDRQLSTAERDEVEAYLTAKWGL